jgi:hypothetical protein
VLNERRDPAVSVNFAVLPELKAEPDWAAEIVKPQVST